ncbi:TPA: SDR family oxidoreductase [Staphylococcus aureus]|nr:SDR family oxidoreductase [Staphylococcus aureus]
MSNILIVGANGNIGYECLRQLEGNIKIAIDYQSHNLKSFNDPKILKFIFDINDSTKYKKIVSYLKLNDIKLDKIVFAQGINPMKNFFNSNFEEFENTINTNFISVYTCLKILYEFLNDFASIVVIASQNGIVGHEDRIDYGCSKAALIHLVKNLSLDFVKYSDKDIKINALSPTYVLNENNENYFKSIQGKKLKTKIPFNKILDIQDVVNGVEFLLSEKSKSMRGNNLILDYGYTIK